MTSPTPIQTAISEMIADGRKAKRTVGQLTLTYHPPAADKAATLAYGKLGHVPTDSESLAVKEAVFALDPRASKLHAAKRENAYWVIRYRLHGVAQQPLIPASEAQP